MAQELVNNALKHAQANQIEVRFSWSDDQLQMHVIDDGIGFDGNSHGNGLGLLSLESRSNLLNASMTFTKNNPRGTQVTVVCPLIAYAEN